VQVGDTLTQLGNELAKKSKVAVVFGGVSINPADDEFAQWRPHVVATPGRCWT
jgi:superfamily II DNA/RNA helicase